MVVKLSACSPSYPTIRVRILLKPNVFSIILYLKRTKINKKRPGLAHLKKQDLVLSISHQFRYLDVYLPMDASCFCKCLTYSWNKMTQIYYCEKYLFQLKNKNNSRNFLGLKSIHQLTIFWSKF